MIKKLASLVGLLIVGFGLLAILAPARVLSTAQSWLAPATLYTVAALRLFAGAVLLAAVPQSRTPTALRILGVLLLLNAVITAFLGLDRSAALLAWAATQSSILFQLGGAIALGVGAFVLYAVSGGRAGRGQGPVL